MAKTPHPMPIARLLEHIARELEASAAVFSVTPGFRAPDRGEALPAGAPELPLGVSSGAHLTQAQGLAAAYVAGARLFELSGGSAEEHIKGKFLLELLGRELGLGQRRGAVLAMEVSGDRTALSAPEMTAFFDAMADASATPVWQACLEAGQVALGRFNNLDRGFLEELEPVISRLAILECRSPAALEEAGGYLLEERGLDLYLKLTPSADLAALTRPVAALRGRAAAAGRSFGLRLAAGEVAGALELAARCAQQWPGIPMAIGGGDYFNIQALVGLGFRFVAADSTLAGPGGLLRLRQLARAVSGLRGGYQVEAPGALALARQLSVRERPGQDRVRLPGKGPLTDCCTAPCRGLCPFGEDVSGALRLMGEGRYRDALRVILDKNPLPHLTGALCDQPCQRACTRVLCDEPVRIREAEALCAQRAWSDLLSRLEPGEPIIGQRIAILGGSPGGMATAVLFARRGVPVTLFEPGEQLCAGLREAIPQAAALADLDGQLLEVLEIDVRLGTPLKRPGEYLKTGYSHVALCLEDGRWPTQGEAQLRLEGAQAQPGEDHPPAERVFTLSPGLGIAQAIAWAHRTVEAVIGAAPAAARPAGRRGSALGKRGKLRMAGPVEEECQRCLECATVCELCVDVCPNRANVPITVLTRATPQILHLDGLCGGCGLCAGVCPYEGSPETDRFTLFETEEDFAASQNAGFVVLDFLARKVRLRLEGKVWETSLQNADHAIPAAIQELMETVFADYPYLLDPSRRQEDQVSLWED